MAERIKPLRLRKILLPWIALGLGTLGVWARPEAETPRAVPVQPSQEEITRYVQDLDVETLLGQTLMVGVQAGEVWPKANEKLREVITKYRVGGVILFEGNFPRQYQLSEEEVAKGVASLTNSLQAAAFSAQPPTHKIPLLIAMDQEGGTNMIVSRGVTWIPNPVFLGGTRSPELTEQAAYVVGSEMRALGVNVVLAPVADINNNAGNDIIGKRAFGAHQAIVAPLSSAFARGLQRGGVLAVAKHFPGHGTSTQNPHFVLPELGYQDMSHLENRDLVPFRQLISEGVDGIMTAHILARLLDREYPVTISDKAVQGLLRDKLKFQGLVFTDDLTSMMGILVDENRKPVRNHLGAARRALEVGSDVLVFGQIWLDEDPEYPERSLTLQEFDEVYNGLKQFFLQPEHRPLLERAAIRILLAKARLVPWKAFGDRSAWQVDLDWGTYSAALKENLKVATAVARESAVLISEDGNATNLLEQANYFKKNLGPLSKDVILHSEDRLTVVSPVFRPPDELLEAIRREWLPKEQIESVHLVYGWRSPEALQEARSLWGENELIERLSKSDKYGQRVPQWSAIARKADEIVRKSSTSRVIVFGALLREHIDVLEKVSEQLPPDSDKKIIVLLFVEPYFVPEKLYSLKNMVFLYASAAPDDKLAVDLLFGRWPPKPVSYLSVSAPPLIDRVADPGAPILRAQEPMVSPGSPGNEGPALVTDGIEVPSNTPRRNQDPRLAPWVLGGLALLGSLALRILWPRIRPGSPPPGGQAASESPQPALPSGLPKSGENNLWYRYADSDAVIVFVHGILSSSRDCWLFQDPQGHEPPQYWPAIIQEDERFGEVGIYLGGYYTAFDAGSYEIEDCASELFGALSRDPERPSETPVLERSRIIFVCHSTGGIVVRYLLTRYLEAFAAKDVGLVLIASPSYGSLHADRLELLSRFYKQHLGLQLRWGNWSLRDLDSRFKDLIDSDRIPGLRGVEAVENHFIFHRRWLPDRALVVTEESAGRYFGAPVLLRKTDHFSAVKPNNRRHPAYELLVDFWTRRFTKVANGG